MDYHYAFELSFKVLHNCFPIIGESGQPIVGPISNLLGLVSQRIIARYKEITLDEAKAGANVEVSFSVTYKMEMKESKKDIEIAVGVLSGLAVLLSAIEAWSWSR